MGKIWLNHSLFVLLSLFFISARSYKFNFNSKGEFTILQFTDLHYGEGDDLDIKTDKLQKDMINKVKPDLIVVSGDGVSGQDGYFWDTFHIPNFYKTHWKRFTQPIADSGIPYAYIPGNHDLDCDLNRYEIAELDMTHPSSVRKTSEGIPGTLNFYVPIYSGQNKDKLALNIWLFDSGRKGCMDQESGWGCVEEPQIQWYEKESKKVKEKHGSDVHHIAFVHIPPPEYMYLANEGEIYGVYGETVCCPLANSGFVDRILAVNEISALFVGHDHFNNGGGWYKGLELSYGQKSGHGGYGDIRGVRVIKFKENVDTNGKLFVKKDHYIIFENGTINTSKDVYVKPGKKQVVCTSEPPEKTFYRLSRHTKIFDRLLLAAEILFGLLVLFALYKIKRAFCIKQKAHFIELTELSDEPVAAAGQQQNSSA